MNFRTLNYIHELLIKNVSDAKKDLQEAYDKRNEFEEDSEDYQALSEIYFEKLRSLDGAESALGAFERNEW